MAVTPGTTYAGSVTTAYNGSTAFVGTFAMAIASGETELCVRIVSDYNGAAVPTITWNGTPLVQRAFVASGNNAVAAIYGLSNPSVGAFNLTFSYTGADHRLAVIAGGLAGVDTTTPVGTAATASNFTGRTATATTVAGDFVVDLPFTESVSMTSPGTGQTAFASNQAGGGSTGAFLASSSYKTATTTSTTMSWTASDFGGIIVLPYKAASGGGGGGRTFRLGAGLDGLSSSGPMQFNPSLG